MTRFEFFGGTIGLLSFDNAACNDSPGLFFTPMAISDLLSMKNRYRCLRF